MYHSCGIYPIPDTTKEREKRDVRLQRISRTGHESTTRVNTDTKMGVAPTQPLSNVATETALESQPILAMDGTIVHTVRLAGRTDQLLGIEGCIRFLALVATREVGALTLVAEVEEEFVQGVLKRLTIEIIPLSRETGILVLLFKVKSLQGHEIHPTLQFHDVREDRGQGGVHEIVLVHRTAAEFETDPRTRPTSLEFLHHTLLVEEVSTLPSHLDARGLLEFIHIADRTQLFRDVLLQIVSETRKTLQFISDPTAGAAASQGLETRDFHLPQALFVCADILHRR